MHRYFFIIAFLSFGKSVSAQTVKADTGTIEVIVKPIKDSLGKETSFIKIEIYRTYNNKNEKLGLMTVVINGVFFLTELDGSFEKYLKNRKVYDFEFMGTGHYPQKKSILIKNGCEYLIKVYLQNKPELIIDKHIDGK